MWVLCLFVKGEILNRKRKGGEGEEERKGRRRKGGREKKGKRKKNERKKREKKWEEMNFKKE